jgi:hypothetical protein
MTDNNTTQDQHSSDRGDRDDKARGGRATRH